MGLKTYPTVEDYLEVVIGNRDLANNKLSSPWFTNVVTFAPIISLARYDVDVLQNMGQTIVEGKPLTEKQGDLACRILLKYTRQLAARGIDVAPVEMPQWRHPLRKMDYSRSIELDDDKIVIKFPFNRQWIDEVRDFAKSSQGQVTWNRDTRAWVSALTEFNLNWAITWARAHGFTIDSDLEKLHSDIINAEATPFAVELFVNGARLDIRNAAPSLIDYINSNLGGFEIDNVVRLIDASPSLGYTIDTDLAEALLQEFGPRFYNLTTHRELKINPDTLLSSDDFVSVIDYADQCRRWPVVIYEPDLSNRMLSRLQSIRSDVCVSKEKNMITFPEGARYIHTVVPLRSTESIPLLLTSSGMIFGGDKQLMIQRAEKVVYCAVDVYNNKSKDKVHPIASETDYQR